MPTSLISTGVQFPDSTIQTTAATAGGTATFTSSGSITAGQPVAMNSNGTVSAIASTAQTAFNGSTIYSVNNLYTWPVIIYHWPTDRFISFIVSSSGSDIRYATGVLSGGSITWTDRGNIASPAVSPLSTNDTIGACVSPNGDYVIFGLVRSGSVSFMSLTFNGSTLASVNSTIYTIGGHNNTSNSSLSVDFCPKANAFLWGSFIYDSFTGAGGYVPIASSFTLSGAGAFTQTTANVYYNTSNSIAFNNIFTAPVVCPGAACVVIGQAVNGQSTFNVYAFTFGKNGAQVVNQNQSLRGYANYSGANFTTGQRGVAGAYDARRGVLIFSSYNITITVDVGLGNLSYEVTDDSAYQYIALNSAYNRYTQDIFIPVKGSNTFAWSYIYTNRGGGGSTVNMGREPSLAQAYTSSSSGGTYSQAGAPDGTMVCGTNISGVSGIPYYILYRPFTSNYNRFVGIATSTVGSGASVTVTVAGGVNAQQSGLLTGMPYYVDPNGGLTPHNTDVFAGVATSATAILLGGSK